VLTEFIGWSLAVDIVQKARKEKENQNIKIDNSKLLDQLMLCILRKRILFYY